MNLAVGCGLEFAAFIISAILLFKTESVWRTNVGIATMAFSASIFSAALYQLLAR